MKLSLLHRQGTEACVQLIFYYLILNYLVLNIHGWRRESGKCNRVSNIACHSTEYVSQTQWVAEESLNLLFRQSLSVSTHVLQAVCFAQH